MPDQSNTAPPACVVLYGIPNCDQVKKARVWLDEHGVAYRFHDFRRDGVSADLLAPWLAALGRDVLLNRKGTTWRALAEADRPHDDAGAIALMLARPAVIKRPVLVHGSQIRVGFSATDYSELF